MALRMERSPADILAGGNGLVDSLPMKQRKDVMALCDRVEIAPGTVVCEAGQPVEHVYFPISGSLSLTEAISGRDSVQTHSIGSEGMLGAALVLDIDRAPQRALAQMPCVALRMNTAKLRSALKQHPALRRALQRYLYVVILELSQNAICIHFHEIKSRLARCLLEAHDQSESDHVSLTHQLLAEMLGVQRGAITLAAIKLQREGAIRYSRGKIFILDRKRLETSSCRCYRATLANYDANLS